MRIVESIHRRSDICIPNWRQAVSNPRVPTWRGTVYAAGKRRDLHGGHGLVGDSCTCI